MSTSRSMKIRSRSAHATLAALAAVLGLASAPAGAGPSPAGRVYYDYARVIDVQPLYRTVRIPREERECWDERVAVRERHGGDSYTPMVVGGIIGGVVGSHIGKGRGRDAATVAGTLLGASIGRDIARADAHEDVHYTTETRCRVRKVYDEEERVDGYRVTYRYRGHTFVTRMPYEPGRRIRVRVRVTPVWDD